MQTNVDEWTRCSVFADVQGLRGEKKTNFKWKNCDKRSYLYKYSQSIEDERTYIHLDIFYEISRRFFSLSFSQSLDCFTEIDMKAIIDSVQNTGKQMKEICAKQYKPCSECN